MHALARLKSAVDAALVELPAFTAPGQIRDLPHQWAPDGDSAWETMVRDELLSFHG